ncbi:MAG: bifunctional riboflavin kinase/FAD synthetase [Actinomycetota bacterium]|nr:bifunctional riboflavin kinase/FAD synthetase [Actinomycetota bacterium]
MGSLAGVEVITDPASCPHPPGGAVVTIGVYDGVHLGHRALIGRVRAMATELGASSAVVTFDRHPATVVRPDSAPLLLTDLEQRIELLGDTDVDYTLVIRFDEERSTESAEEFVRDVLVGCLGARAVVVGHDFHFGRNRGGNVAMLQEMGAGLGFDVLGINLVADDDASEVVSSTRIRGLLGDGDVAGAARLLGRPHEVRGIVQHGDARGRELGFPTANVAVPADVLLPADGIYAGWYERPDGTVHPSAMSLGRRPTFYADAELSLLECFLLEFEGDLYDEAARVRFIERLRGEVKFDSIDDLVKQMAQDVADARELLG